ncbi:MAG: thiamine phosphate synthase [Acidobacteriota bacterium]
MTSTWIARAGPLNAIVDADVAVRAGWTPVDLAAAYLAGGARFLQIRAKSLSGAAFLELTSRICAIAHPAGAVVVVNDRVDIARIGGADGVHVGQDDLAPAAARTLLGPAAIVGLSTHSERQIEAALAQPLTYLAVGPVFGTATKATGYSAVALDLVRHAAERVRFELAVRRGERQAIGLVAIGGITLDRAASVIEAGATAVAVITDLIADGDPEGRVRAYLARLDRTGRV